MPPTADELSKMDAPVTDIFAEIYRTHSWGGRSQSGPGSDPKYNRRYLRTLQRLVDSANVRYVLDIGCGDWSLARYIDWSSAHYVGVDVVPEMIAHHTAQFARPHVSFKCLNILEDDLPEADLVIIKDVLQHFTTAQVMFVLNKLSRFQLVLATNDCSRFFCYRKWRWIPRYAPFGQTPNSDIDVGGYRPIRLNEAPFHWAAHRLLQYWVPIDEHICDKKEVLLRTSRS